MAGRHTVLQTVVELLFLFGIGVVLDGESVPVKGLEKNTLEDLVDAHLEHSVSHLFPRTGRIIERIVRALVHARNHFHDLFQLVVSDLSETPVPVVEHP